jgi:acid phosphatase (class A)
MATKKTRAAPALAIIAALALAGCQTPAAETPAFVSTAPTHPASGERNPAVQIDALLIVVPPPAADGALERAERAVVAGPWSEARRAQAREDNQIDVFAAFDAVLGPGFTAEALPLTAALLDRAGRAAGFAGDRAKFVHRRARPFLADASIETCLPADDRLRASYSYPSGHAALGWGWALVLAELFPDRAEALIARGRDYGDSRVVCGVHYPSDVQAGRLVGAAAIARLHADADFRRALDAARGELAGAYPSPD